jgi:hypothetical protein
MLGGGGPLGMAEVPEGGHFIIGSQQALVVRWETETGLLVEKRQWVLVLPGSQLHQNLP